MESEQYIYKTSTLKTRLGDKSQRPSVFMTNGIVLVMTLKLFVSSNDPVSLFSVVIPTDQK